MPFQGVSVALLVFIVPCDTVRETPQSVRHEAASHRDGTVRGKSRAAERVHAHPHGRTGLQLPSAPSALAADPPWCARSARRDGRGGRGGAAFCLLPALPRPPPPAAEPERRWRRRTTICLSCCWSGTRAWARPACCSASARTPSTPPSSPPSVRGRAAPRGPAGGRRGGRGGGGRGRTGRRGRAWAAARGRWGR